MSFCRKDGRSRASMRSRHSYFLYSTKSAKISVFDAHEIFFVPDRDVQMPRAQDARKRPSFAPLRQMIIINKSELL